MIKGIRGAITIEENTSNSLKSATIELLEKITKENNVRTEDISHAIFTVTEDINCEYPAKFARVNFGWKDVPMMCYNEMKVENSLKMCLRVLVVVNCTQNFTPKFVYLKGAENLRK